MASTGRPQAAGFVLAGGQSTRMGRDKARIMLNGRCLVEIAVATLRTLTSDVSIVGDRPDLEEFAPIVPDRHRQCGPLGGIEAALSATCRGLNIVLGVDTPFVPSSLLAHLLARANATGAEITVPRMLGQYQPLCAVYRASVLPAVQEALAARRFKVDGIFAPEDLCVVEAVEIAGLGVAADAFANLNRPQEVAEAETKTSFPGRVF